MRIGKRRKEERRTEITIRRCKPKRRRYARGRGRTCTVKFAGAETANKRRAGRRKPAATALTI